MCMLASVIHLLQGLVRRALLLKLLVSHLPESSTRNLLVPSLLGRVARQTVNGRVDVASEGLAHTLLIGLS